MNQNITITTNNTTRNIRTLNWVSFTHTPPLFNTVCEVWTPYYTHKKKTLPTTKDLVFFSFTHCWWWINHVQMFIIYLYICLKYNNDSSSSSNNNKQPEQLFFFPLCFSPLTTNIRPYHWDWFECKLMKSEIFFFFFGSLYLYCTCMTGVYSIHQKKGSVTYILISTFLSLSLPL